MANWEEVKRLAADFQKVQSSSTTQKLSERNCIEIISWLVNRKLIDLIFTCDGKEYLTPSQLVQDIIAELYVNGGRVNFVELAKSIGVDLNHITNHINDVVHGRKDVHIVLGQLIDTSYITKIAGEINEKLQQQGQLYVSDLTIQYDLPAEFLQQHVLEKYLGKLIYGEQDKKDPKLFFTQSFIARSKAKIRGALVGITRPMPVSTIIDHINITDKLFFSLFDQTSMYGFLTSRIAGALYIPNVYSRSQNEWVTNFYKQNGYLEFDAMTRIGISDHKVYLKKQLDNDDIIFLKSCIVSKTIIERIDVDIVECISSKTYVDLQSNLPSVLNDDDIKLVIDKVLTPQKQKQVVIIDYYVISTAFLSILSGFCDNLVEERAKLAVESGKYQQYQTEIQISSNRAQKTDDVEEAKVDKREERRRKAVGGKSGGGTQGRETKTKSTKKHTYRTTAKNLESDDYDVIQEKKIAFEIVKLEDVETLIESRLEEEGLEELRENIANHLLPSLNEKGLEIAAGIYATTVSDLTATRRNTHNEVQNKLNVLLGDIRLFEKGVKLFPQDIQPVLCKYLLKTLCTDILMHLLNYISVEEGINVVTDSFTYEQKVKFINDLAPDYKLPLQTLIKTVAGHSIDEFMTAAEESLVACSMILKKIDKKKDRLIILNHKHGLLDQLEKCDDPALALHLSSLVIFITATQNILHASGRHVASILSFLKPSLTPIEFSNLTSYHDMVLLMLSGGTEAENASEQLQEKLSLIKTIGSEYKKVIDKS